MESLNSNSGIGAGIGNDRFWTKGLVFKQFELKELEQKCELNEKELSIWYFRDAAFHTFGSNTVQAMVFSDQE